jgi:hypothetical protein
MDGVLNALAFVRGSARCCLRTDPDRIPSRKRDRRRRSQLMGAYAIWGVLILAALAGLVLLLFLPGLWLLGLLVAVIAILLAVAYGIGRGVDEVTGGGDATGEPDIVARRREHEARQDERRRRAR